MGTSAQPTRVLLVGRSAARMQFEQQLQDDPSIRVAGHGPSLDDWAALVAELDPDVVVLDLPSTEDLRDWEAHLDSTVPLVVIADRFEAADLKGWLIQATNAGVHGVLTANPTTAELVGAIQAAAAGLVTMSPELTQPLFDSDESNHAREDAMEGSAGTPEHLTPREREVLDMMMEGLSNKEIAADLNVSTHTVKFHISSILGKLGASSRTEATTIALRRGLITI